MNNMFKYSEEEYSINKVLKKQQDDLNHLSGKQNSVTNTLDNTISEVEYLLKKIGCELPKSDKNINLVSEKCNSPIIFDSWKNIVAKADNKYIQNIVLEDIFAKDEIEANSQYITALREEFYGLNKLDKWDYAIAGIIGTISALIDFFFITKMNLITGDVVATSLKSGVENFLDTILPLDLILELEKKYKVSFDVSTNTKKISQKVLGLNPKTHRFQSLGHDPLLGFIFGINDLMNGTLTAIDGNGRIIIQSVQGAEPMKFVQALIIEFGHLLSDINATSKTGLKLSIPAPLTPLLQLIQIGHIPYKGKVYTVADLSKIIYKEGYNFNQFIGMSIPVFIQETLIRLYSVLKNDFADPKIHSYKTDLILLISNSILCAENVGKVVVTKNPFAINYISWIYTAKYTTKVMKHMLVDNRVESLSYVQNIIDLEMDEVYSQINETCKKVFNEKTIIL